MSSSGDRGRRTTPFRQAYLRGVKKSAHDDLNEIVNKYLVKGTIITENNRVTCQNALRDYYVEKGFLDAQVRVIEEADEQLMNAVKLIFDIDKGPRIKIESITFSGNENVKARSCASR